MTKKVIIVGGGVAGLAMSLFLKKANIESAIYEQATAFSFERKDRAEKVFNSGSILDNLNLEATDDYAFFGKGLNIS